MPMLIYKNKWRQNVRTACALAGDDAKALGMKTRPIDLKFTLADMAHSAPAPCLCINNCNRLLVDTVKKIQAL